MIPKDFHIGLEFWCSGKRWRCTDVGSRVVVAISLEAHEVVSSESDPNDPTKRIERRYMSSDPIWLDGPPYGIVEDVFDEDSLEICSLTSDSSPTVQPSYELFQVKCFCHPQETPALAS